MGCPAHAFALPGEAGHTRTAASAVSRRAGQAVAQLARPRLPGWGCPMARMAGAAPWSAAQFVSLIAFSHIYAEDMAYTEEKGGSSCPDAPREPDPPR